MNTPVQVLIILTVFIIIILFSCWIIPSAKIKDARELLKVILPRIPIVGMLQSLSKKEKVKEEH